MNNKRKEKNKEIKIENNKLSFNYFIEETYEC
jgi:tmRNA-binding protein